MVECMVTMCVLPLQTSRFAPIIIMAHHGHHDAAGNFHLSSEGSYGMSLAESGHTCEKS